MSNTTSKLSIVTINYNNAKGLERTLSSVWNEQTYPNFEHIVIDGGSTDGSVDIIKRYSDKLAYWVSEPDKGIYNAMNKGIDKAQGEYLLFLNSGDWLEKESLKNLFSYNFNEDIVSGNLINVEPNGKARVIKSPKTIKLSELMLHYLPHPATFIKRELFSDKRYNEEYKIISDWIFWIEELIFNNRSYLSIDTNISYYNLLGISSKSENRQKIEEEKTSFLKNRFGERFEMDNIYKCFKAIDIISKHKSNQLITSKSMQRKLRIYYKILLFIKKFF
ncbi:MAG: glycosyltransferase [Bacteroidales bacterium]|nr:glycosyltransferase [Bacteroidales bacterium]